MTQYLFLTLIAQLQVQIHVWQNADHMRLPGPGTRVICHLHFLRPGHDWELEKVDKLFQILYGVDPHHEAERG